LTWDLVATFLVLAEELHFGRAAERLRISRQTLSRRIDRLEAQADAQLVVRSTRRVELTPAGMVLRDHAALIAEAMDDMTEQVELVRADRPLSVGLSTDLTAPWTTGVETWVGRRGTPAVVERRATGEVVPLVRAGRLDLVLLVGELPNEPHSIVVGHEPAVVVFPDTHPASSQRSIQAGDLRDLVVAVSDAGPIEHHRAMVEQLHDDPDLPYVLAPPVGTVLPGLVHAARQHGAATVVLARGVERADTTGLTALPMDPPFSFAVTLIARPGLPPELLRSLADHLLDLPNGTPP
jgi:DNA-binding transcriptional LysR family regulator